MTPSFTSQHSAKQHQFCPLVGSCFGADKGQTTVLVHRRLPQVLSSPEFVSGLGYALMAREAAGHRATADDITDLQFHKIATAQLAVDGEVEQGAIPEPLLMVEVKPDRPDLLHFEWTFGPHEAAGIPGSAVVISRVEAGSSHDALILEPPPVKIKRVKGYSTVFRKDRIGWGAENVGFRWPPIRPLMAGAQSRLRPFRTRMPEGGHELTFHISNRGFVLKAHISFKPQPDIDEPLAKLKR
jgi:hypothetical protein